MELLLVATLLVSISLGSITLFLTYINWRILNLSKGILNISVELLKETIIIREETVWIRKISEDVLVESIRLRKALGDPTEEMSKKEDEFTTKKVKGIKD